MKNSPTLEMLCPKCGGHATQEVAMIDGKERRYYECVSGCVATQYCGDPQDFGLSPGLVPGETFGFVLDDQGKPQEVYPNLVELFK